MKNIFLAFIAALLLVGFTGCIKNDVNEQGCQYDPCRYKAPAAEVQTIKDYLAANAITATEHCSGIFYIIENEGTGRTPEACGGVAAKYKGTFFNGDLLDQSTDAVQFGLNGVIQGWTNGVPLIKEGGRIILFIPPSLGYGSQDYRNREGLVVVPGNSYLKFEIDLVAVL